MDHNLVPDSPLPSTVEAITADCPQIRILVLGKTGCGKSSLINKVFGVEKDIAQVSHDRPGEAKIDREFRHPNNNRFILHDSEGFEPGQDEKLNTVKNFIEERTRTEMPPKDKLHVVWICISVPTANDRVKETGVQEIFKMVQQRRIPTIVVFTKYDELVTTKVMTAGDAVVHLKREERWRYGEGKASEAAENLCIRPWRETAGKVPLILVSTKLRYKDTIQKLIEATDREIQQQRGVQSYTEPDPLNWAAAQRGDNGLKIKASVDVGRKKYWSGLLSSADFAQQKLRQCLDVIHRDIVAVWNIRDSNTYLISDDFKAKMSVLVDDLVTDPKTPTPNDGLTVATVVALASAASSSAGIVILAAGSAVLFAKWIFDVYQNMPENVACVMGYIADLTIVMHRLSAVEISKESVVSVLQVYARSEEISQVHNDIRKFVNENSTFRLRDKDYTLNEIIRLIENHLVQVPRT